MKPYLHIFIAILVFLPLVTFAQGLQGYVASAVKFISNVLIPFLLGIGFLIFSINAIRFFVIEGNNEKGRENAKALALYSVMAVVAILIFWGAISLLVRGTGLNGKNVPTPDYLEKNGVQFKATAPTASNPNTPTSIPCVDGNGVPTSCW